MQRLETKNFLVSQFFCIWPSELLFYLLTYLLTYLRTNSRTYLQNDLMVITVSMKAVITNGNYCIQITDSNLFFEVILPLDRSYVIFLKPQHCTFCVLTLMFQHSKDRPLLNNLSFPFNISSINSDMVSFPVDFPS